MTTTDTLKEATPELVERILGAANNWDELNEFLSELQSKATEKLGRDFSHPSYDI